MLHQIRPFCGLIVYLLLVSYTAIICKEPLSNLYYSVVYTASVFHLNTNIWNSSSSHDHGQEITFSELEALLDNQHQQKRQDDHTTTDLPKKKLKYFNQLRYQPFEWISLGHKNFSLSNFKSDLFQVVEAPPPKV